MTESSSKDLKELTKVNDVDDIEAEIAKEVSTLKRPRKERRFSAWFHPLMQNICSSAPPQDNCQTDTQCRMIIITEPVAGEVH